MCLLALLGSLVALLLLLLRRNVTAVAAAAQQGDRKKIVIVGGSFAGLFWPTSDAHPSIVQDCHVRERSQATRECRSRSWKSAPTSRCVVLFWLI